MSNRYLVLCIVLEIMLLFLMGRASDGVCTKSNDRCSVLKLSVDRRLNESDGRWMTLFSARRVDSGNSTTDLRLEATHSIAEHQGNRVTQVELVVKDVHASQSTKEYALKDRLVFHHRHARNVVLSNGGLSTQRINLEDLVNSAAFTNRPLNDNEIFEVRLDKIISDKSHCHGIGVMAHSPDEIKLYESMYYSDVTWMYHNVNIYGTKKVLISNYGIDSCNIKVGNTVGVMKRDNGSLHFFVNGEDQGPAITNAPSVVYGIYEVRGFAVKSTIVS